MNGKEKLLIFLKSSCNLMLLSVHTTNTGCEEFLRKLLLDSNFCLEYEEKEKGKIFTNAGFT